ISTTTLTPLSSKTWSPSFSTVSKSNLYSRPEQPPLLTPTRTKGLGAACFSLSNLSMYSFALDETVIMVSFYVQQKKDGTVKPSIFEIRKSSDGSPFRLRWVTIPAPKGHLL